MEGHSLPIIHLLYIFTVGYNVRISMLETWLAGVIDFNGYIGVRLGAKQIQPYISIYSRKRESLEQLREIFPSFSPPMFASKGLFMSQIMGVSKVKAVLERIIGELMILREPGRLVLEFCNLRLEHLNENYTLGELQLIQRIVKITSRPSMVEQRLEALQPWL